MTVDDLSDFIHEVFEQMGRTSSGSMTLNELRIGNHVLRCAHRGRPLSISTIARELNLPRTTVSRTVRRMVERGAVQIVTSDHDDRVRLVQVGDRQRELIIAGWTAFLENWLAAHK